MPLKRLARMQALEAAGIRRAAPIAPPSAFLPSLEILPPTADQPSQPDGIQYPGAADAIGTAETFRVDAPAPNRTA